GGIRNRRLRRSFAQGARYFFPGANFLRGNLKESLGSDLTFAKLINSYSVARIARFLAGGISNCSYRRIKVIGFGAQGDAEKLGPTRILSKPDVGKVTQAA